MFRNYFKSALRNLMRYKGFALINIASLTIGIIGCLVIGLFVWDEWQYDQHVPDKDQIFRIYEERTDNNGRIVNAPVPPVFSEFLKQQYPEVEEATRMMMLNDQFLMESPKEKGYEIGGKFVDPSFIEFFSLPVKNGDARTALEAPKSIVLSEKLANRYFKNEDPLGKTIFIDKDTFEVKAVLSALPDHFHLNFNYLMPIKAVDIDPERMKRWTWHQFYSYIKLKPGSEVNQLQSKFQKHFTEVIQPTLGQTGSRYLPFFQPLKDIHLKSADFVYDNAERGNGTYVKGLTIIALFVLIIACFNFINLATARSFRRAREIGVRKVVGAGRRQIIFQFIGESILLSMISMILAVIATVFIVPFLNAFTGKSISFNPFINPLLGLLILSVSILIGILAGIYPALVLSGFQPVKVLKNMKAGIGRGAGWLRPALVVVQFALSVLLIISTIIVYRQTKFLNTKELGFDKSQVLYFQVRGDLQQKLETFKNELKKIPGIISVTSGYGLPGDAFAGDGIFIPSSERKTEFPASFFMGDEDYVKTLGLNIIAGRDFSRAMATDTSEAFIINETAVREFGFVTPEKALGQSMHWKEWSPLDTSNPLKKGKVIGVVQDFHYKSLHEKISPVVIHIYPRATFTVAAKLRNSKIQNTIASVNQLWNRFVPGFPLEYKFMDESYGKMYNSEEKLSRLLWIFAILAIAVGCMGLFGLAAFNAEQRTKEIGIRKVLGAGILNIIGLLSRNFLILVVLAALIAFPVALWAMNNWLNDFPYRTELSWWIFALAIFIALLIAFLTISFQSIKVATSNPVKSLRTE